MYQFYSVSAHIWVLPKRLVHWVLIKSLSVGTLYVTQMRKLRLRKVTVMWPFHSYPPSGNGASFWTRFCWLNGMHHQAGFSALLKVWSSDQCLDHKLLTPYVLVCEEELLKQLVWLILFLLNPIKTKNKKKNGGLYFAFISSRNLSLSSKP